MKKSILIASIIVTFLVLSTSALATGVVYDSFADENESSGSGSFSLTMLGNQAPANNSVSGDILILSVPTDANVTILSMNSTVTAGSPELLNFIFDVYICTTNATQLDANTTLHANCNDTATLLINDVNLSAEFGNTSGFHNLTLDSTFLISNNTPYILEFEYVSGGNDTGSPHTWGLWSDATPSLQMTRRDLGSGFSTPFTSIPGYQMFGTADADGDGFDSIATGGTDCNDLNATERPLLNQSLNSISSDITVCTNTYHGDAIATYMLVQANGIIIDFNNSFIDGQDCCRGLNTNVRSNLIIRNAIFNDFTEAIIITGGSNNTITGINFTSNTDGIELSSGTTNHVISNNRMIGNVNGLFFISNSNINVTNNVLISNTRGIVLSGGTGNIFLDNVISSSGSWDIESANSPTSIFNNITLDTANIWFTSEDTRIKSVPSPPSDQFPDFLNVSVYLNMTNTSSAAWSDINISFPAGTDTDFLSLYRNNGVNWNTIPEAEVIDTGANTIGANVTSFSIFAPGIFETTCSPSTLLLVVLVSLLLVIFLMLVLTRILSKGFTTDNVKEMTIFIMIMIATISVSLSMIAPACL